MPGFSSTPPPESPQQPEPATAPRRPAGSAAASRRSRRLGRRLLEAVTARLPVKLAALFFAFVLWLVVGTEEPSNKWVDVRLALVLDSNVTLQDTLPHVQALVVGRERELLKLYAEQPVIRRVVTSNTPDAVTLELRPEDVILPANVTARVTDVRPNALPLAFTVTLHRRLPVRPSLQVSADSGLRLIEPPRVDPESVDVRGPRAAVRTLEAIPTERTILVVRDTIMTRLVPLDTAGLGVQVSPAEVRVHVSALRDTSRQATPKPGGPRQREP